MYVDVLVSINSLNDKTFYYSVPSDLIKDIEIGKRVLVPFGNRNINGIILSINNKLEFDYDLKEIISVIDKESLLNEEMIELGKYMSETYICSLMSCYQSMLPSALKFNKKDINIKFISYIEKLKDYIPNKKSEENILKLYKNKNKIIKSKLKKKNI